MKNKYFHKMLIKINKYKINKNNFFYNKKYILINLQKNIQIMYI